MADNPAPDTKGRVVHWPVRYDLLVALLTLGRERRFRERLLEPARLRTGESVLDVGCGTGTLAIAAKRLVGDAGEVHGVDPSPQMIERARKKARRAAVALTLDTGVAESLSYPTGRFDAVLSTVMLHHLPGTVRATAVREMRRVLKPGGRLLAVDFVTTGRKGLLGHFHRHGRVDPGALMALVSDAGLQVVESGPVGTWGLQFVVAHAPAGSSG
jgi:ubiquinone/menaquinone biosynthesis C-methylase UbiE